VSSADVEVGRQLVGQRDVEAKPSVGLSESGGGREMVLRPPLPTRQLIEVGFDAVGSVQRPGNQTVFRA
jgi:hypothetical protein